MSQRVALIEQRLRAALDPQAIAIRDDSDRHKGHAGAKESGGGHFKVRIVAAAFGGLSPLQRHRRVNAALQDLIPHEIHALSIEALTPAEDA
ncbi:MAG: BolA family protein [Candidatus Competibacterales bacterium]